MRLATEAPASEHNGISKQEQEHTYNCAESASLVDNFDKIELPAAAAGLAAAGASSSPVYRNSRAPDPNTRKKSSRASLLGNADSSIAVNLHSGRVSEGVSERVSEKRE